MKINIKGWSQILNVETWKHCVGRLIWDLFWTSGLKGIRVVPQTEWLFPKGPVLEIKATLQRGTGKWSAQCGQEQGTTFLFKYFFIILTAGSCKLISLQTVQNIPQQIIFFVGRITLQEKKKEKPCNWIARADSCIDNIPSQNVCFVLCRTRACEYNETWRGKFYNIENPFIHTHLDINMLNTFCHDQAISNQIRQYLIIQRQNIVSINVFFHRYSTS